jgi:hypothetical protein
VFDWHQTVLNKASLGTQFTPSEAALRAASLLESGKWEPFVMDHANTVVMVHCKGHQAELHFFADGGNLIAAGRDFMSVIFKVHPEVTELFAAVRNPRVARFIMRFLGFSPVKEHGEYMIYNFARCAA